VISGTREWSVASVNFCTGCEHNCRYCYARANALRFKRIATAAEWKRMKLRPAEVSRRRRPQGGTVMVPTTHDIVPRFLDESLEVIGKLLDTGDKVLIVSKPHIDCVRRICQEFRQARERIMFRFSIGAWSDEILAYWEPAAPTLSERQASLHLAYGKGFVTSVSMEPLLQPERVELLVERLSPFVSDSLWIGKLNQIDRRTVPSTRRGEIDRVKAGQTDKAVRRVYERLKDHPLVKWKESYKKVLGLRLAETAGLDR